MWFNRKSHPPIRSLVGEGTKLVGELHFTDGLRIDGEVEGDVIAAPDVPSIVVISENARIMGKVKAGHVIINGEVRGPVVSEQLLELQPKARIFGDVRYEMLEMHVGAMVEGELRPLRGAEKPALKLAASSTT
jgi:cytoskeletal protein CcmA (bactofilin family)